MPLHRIFSGAISLNNVVESFRITYDGDSNFCDIPASLNVIIDNSGSIKTRLGKSQLFSGNIHSLFSIGKFCFFVSDGNLYRYVDRSNIVLVQPGVGAAKMHYEVVFGKCYMSNGTVKLIVDDYSVKQYQQSVIVKNESDTRVFGFPEDICELCLHAGRMLALSEDGNRLWISEPGDPGSFDIASGPISFDGAHSLKSVESGFYISDSESLVFVSGHNKEDFVKTKKALPAISGTCVVISASEYGDSVDFPGKIMLAVTQDGVVACFSNGTVVNLTKEKINLSDIISGSACFFQGKYIYSLEVK